MYIWRIGSLFLEYLQISAINGFEVSYKDNRVEHEYLRTHDTFELALNFSIADQFFKFLIWQASV